MFWIGLATLIMILSGTGDDTLAFRKGAQMTDIAIDEKVADQKRAKKAHAAVADANRVFATHRAALDKMGKCIEKVDRTYKVTRADYLACVKNSDAVWEKTRHDYVAAQARLQAALTDEEWSAIRKSVMDQARK